MSFAGTIGRWQRAGPVESRAVGVGWLAVAESQLSTRVGEIFVGASGIEPSQ